MQLQTNDLDQLEFEWDMSMLHAQLDILNAVRREMPEDQRGIVERYMVEIEDEIAGMTIGEEILT